MIRPAIALLALASIGLAGDALGEVRRRWAQLDRAGKTDALLGLGMRPSSALLDQCRTWFEDPDPLVRGQVARLVAQCMALGDLRAKGRRMLAAYLERHLAERTRREREEFREVCGEHGREAPADDEMTAGRDWQDPYDEARRALPPEIAEERAHMREVVSAVESTRDAALRKPLLRVLLEHHDPEVVVRVVRCFGAWKDWRALAPMADLWRIQQYGRAIGGRDVIGRERYEELRLKWDVHKDRLWWSRPEYLPRVSHPIAEAVTEITGRKLASCRALDAWLLSNERTLRQHEVELSGAFRERARSSQD